MPRSHRSPLTLDLASVISRTNPADPCLAPPPQTPFMDNSNKENIPPPRPRAVRVVPMHSPPFIAPARTAPTVTVAVEDFKKRTIRPELWKLQRPVTPPMHLDEATGLWGRDKKRVFMEPTLWEHPSSECLLLTAEQDAEEARGDAEVVGREMGIGIYDKEMERVHRNLLFARFRRRA